MQMDNFVYAVVGDSFGDHEFRSVHDQAEITDVWCPQCGSLKTKYAHGIENSESLEELVYVPPTVYCKVCKVRVTLDLPSDPTLLDVQEKGVRIPYTPEFKRLWGVPDELDEHIGFTDSHIYKLNLVK